jgi:hypothetical protein
VHFQHFARGKYAKWNSRICIFWFRLTNTCVFYSCKPLFERKSVEQASIELCTKWHNCYQKNACIEIKNREPSTTFLKKQLSRVHFQLKVNSTKKQTPDISAKGLRSTYYYSTYSALSIFVIWTLSRFISSRFKIIVSILYQHVVSGLSSELLGFVAIETSCPLIWYKYTATVLCIFSISRAEITLNHSVFSALLLAQLRTYTWIIGVKPYLPRMQENEHRTNCA